MKKKMVRSLAVLVNRFKISPTRKPVLTEKPCPTPPCAGMESKVFLSRLSR